jgi:hypothetical protein
LFEQGSGEQGARAGAVVGCVGVAPVIRGPPKTLKRAFAIAFGEKHRTVGAVSGGQDSRALELGGELDEFSYGCSCGCDVATGECDVDLRGEQSSTGEFVPTSFGERRDGGSGAGGVASG